MSSEVGERVAKLEQIVHNHEGKINSKSNRIDRLESYNETLIRLVTSVEIQGEASREESKSLNRTLRNIDSNLTTLNSISNQLQSDVVSIGERVEDIEKTSKNNNINIPNLLTKVVVGVFMLIPTILLSWFMFTSGMK